MKYIDAEKLKTWLESEADIEFKKTEENANSPVLCHFHNGCRMQALDTIDFINSLQQEQPKIGLEEFTQKMDDWKARYNHPDNIPIKATMAFTARMFYMYPDIAREWYAGLPKATQD